MDRIYHHLLVLDGEGIPGELEFADRTRYYVVQADYPPRSTTKYRTLASFTSRDEADAFAAQHKADNPGYYDS